MADKEPIKVEIVEIIDRIPPLLMIAVLVVGVATGAAFIYFFTEHVEEGKANNA